MSENEQPMTMRELREAAEDKSHPRHAEAVQRNKELAEHLKPAMDRLRQTMAASIPTVTPSVEFIKHTIPTSVIPKFELETPMTEQHRKWQNSVREQQEQLERALDASAKAGIERQEMEDQRADQTLEVLASMDAQLSQLNNRIKAVDAQIEAGNTSASKMAGRTITVAVLTLLATVAGIIVTVLLSH